MNLKVSVVPIMKQEKMVIALLVPKDTHHKQDKTADHVTTTRMVKDVDSIVLVHCDIVEGCVEIKKTTGTLVDETSATVHRLDSSLPDFKLFAISQSEFEPQFTQPLEKNARRQLHEYENYSNNLGSMSCETLNGKRQMNINSKHEGITNINSAEDDKLDYYNIFKTKSESDIFGNRVLQK
ncbi:unnamed protein product [Mytilus coruscus]|uniref:Uncharacterized protein n=1 Tax=Mytilus coruscus TaxID=42192 RepID=A0A6J8E4T2_MYTCO|nr:unnamed protein product [Mytilus coruscus]